MTWIKSLGWLLGLAWALTPSTAARADDVLVAVAANFSQAAREIGALFERATGHRAVFSVGATGQLYTQITQDAPFEVFLAADQERPRKAVDAGLAVADSLMTYAVGRLALFSIDAGLVEGEATLRGSPFARFAIANPQTAPYGAAAVMVLQALGVYDQLESKLVQGTNIAQTYQFVLTGNAELGFVALSQIVGNKDGSRWLVPSTLHPPIAQDAVLLRRGADKPAAMAFLSFLDGPEARAVIERFGYAVVD